MQNNTPPSSPGESPDDRNPASGSVPADRAGATGETPDAQAGATGTTPARSGRRVGTAVAVVAVIAVIVIVAVVLLRFASGDGDNSGEGTSPQASQPTATSEAPYVDDQGGLQQHPLDAAPGDPRGIEGMALTVGADTAPVDPIQLTDTGMLIPPLDVQRLGWYSASAVPGQEGAAGSTVITGHINYEGQGMGFAQEFTTMTTGEEFHITMDGQDKAFRVTQAPYRLAKGAPLPDVVNDASGPNKVVLITCGGDFVGGQLGYADNIITVAEPV